MDGWFRFTVLCWLIDYAWTDFEYAWIKLIVSREKHINSIIVISLSTSTYIYIYIPVHRYPPCVGPDIFMWVSNPRTNSSYSMFSKPSLFLHPSSGAHGSLQSLATLLRRKRIFRNTEPSDKLNGYQALHWGRISHLSGWSMVPDVDHGNCCKQERPNCHTLAPAHCWDHDDHHEMRTACVFFQLFSSLNPQFSTSISLF